MRKKRNNQLEFCFQAKTLAVTQKYYERYERISDVLDANPAIVELVHADLKTLLTRKDRSGPGRKCEYTSDSILRVLICQILEEESLRGVVVRIDDSTYLRYFTRIYNGPMLDFSSLCSFKNAIKPRTWKKINVVLAEAAVANGCISGDRLRLDTTAYETNIRWPSDSGLLWDTYRVLARLIEGARKSDADLGYGRRLQKKRARRLFTSIARHSRRKNASRQTLKRLYEPLLGLVEAILKLGSTVAAELDERDRGSEFGLESLSLQIRHYVDLGQMVVDQTTRRVLEGEQVPNDEKIFSIFEPHTELLKRGKAGKPIEFGHMVAFQQVEGKFISDYQAFDEKPVEHSLVDDALRAHRELFGLNPRELSADKGYYESVEKIDELATEIDVVSIAKKGRRNEDETSRERSKAFRVGQSFRAGIEGTISFLKRSLRMWRCMNKGWEHYAATVGATVFVHNLIILSRAPGTG